MPYRITIGGIEVACDTAKEVAAAVDEFQRLNDKRRNATPAQEKRRDSSSSDAGRTHRGWSNEVRAFQVLRETPLGVAAPDFAEHLGLANAKGTGSMLTRVKSFLAGHDIRWEDVVTREKKAKGAVWYPGPRIDEALERLNSEGRESQP